MIRKQAAVWSEDIDTGARIDIILADSFFSRFIGLMGRKQLLSGQGLLLQPCSSIHMCFMRFAIDAVWLDENMRVIRVKQGLLPWLGLSWCRKASAVLELSAGQASACFCVQGCQLKINGAD